jgi:glycosyltransferase involved in cell wall biosynthesis
MSTHPTLAMLVPAYNAAKHLPRLLESALGQTEQFDEIWVYDDCSSDNTAEIAGSYGARVVSGEINRGCSRGKNILASLTSAGWLHFHDADDELYPNFVALARRWITDDRFDVVLFPYEERDDATGELISCRMFKLDPGVDARSYAIKEQINPFCGLYRREAFLRAGGYDEDPLVLHNEDVAMHIRLAFSGLTFAAESQISIVNHRRTGSMSSVNRLNCVRAHFQVMRKTAELEGAERYASEIADRLWVAVGGLAAELDWHTADQAVLLATRLAGVPHSDPVFAALCHLSPLFAVRLREGLIRALKPHLRNGYPGWRLHYPALGRNDQSTVATFQATPFRSRLPEG